MGIALVGYVARRRCTCALASAAEELFMSYADFDPEYVFSHHPATPEKLAHYAAIHDAAKEFARALLAHSPPCADRAAALRLLREASMMACAAVALDGRLK